jgi:hypothetical protein
MATPAGVIVINIAIKSTPSSGRLVAPIHVQSA